MITQLFVPHQALNAVVISWKRFPHYLSIRRTRQQHVAIDEANQDNDNDVPTQEEPGDHNEVACPDTYTEVAAVPQLEVQASPPDQQHPPHDTEPGGVIDNQGPELSSRESVDEVPPSKLPLCVKAGFSKTKKVKRVEKRHILKRITRYLCAIRTVPQVSPNPTWSDALSVCGGSISRVPTWTANMLVHGRV